MSSLPLAVLLATATPVQTAKQGSDWTTFENLHEIVAGSALDFSKMDLCEAPAGRYGWLKSVNGHAEFERRPNVPARFYGVNLCNDANYLNDAEVERLTDRLVRLGYNAVRFHHHDDLWSKDTDGARQKFDRLVAACVRKGIYMTTDLYVSRHCTWRELGVDRDGEGKSAKLRMMTDETAFANWQAYARAFLTHRNPYTGRSLAEEPAMPMLVLLNESSPHSNWNHVLEIPAFRPLWKTWLGEVRARVPGAYPEADPDVFPTHGGWWDPSRENDTLAAFWTWLNERFCRKATRFLREELHVKALISTENNGPVLPEILRVRAAVGDYTDLHWYTEHASPASKSQRKEMGVPAHHVFHDKDVLNSCRHPYRSAAFSRVWGRPFAISESNMGGPNTYRAMAGLLTGAYAAIQDWTGIWTFALAHSKAKLFDGCTASPGRFDLALDPLLQATDRLPVVLFLRGDQATPKAAYANVFTREAMDPANDKCLRNAPNWASSDYAWRSRVGVAFDEPLPAGVTPIRAYPPARPAETPPSAGVAVDETRGEIAVSGALTAGGFAQAEGTIEAGFLKAHVGGHHALVAVTSLDRSPLAESPRLLLWHLTDLHGEGFSWGGRCKTPSPSGSFTGILNWGTGERLLAHVGTAGVTLALKHPEAYAVWALDAVGNRKERIAAKADENGLSFTAAIRPAAPARFYYEIVAPSRPDDSIKSPRRFDQVAPTTRLSRPDDSIESPRRLD